MLFSSGTNMPPMSDKRERLSLHIIFALFLKFGLRYLFTFGTLKLLVL